MIGQHRHVAVRLPKFPPNGESKPIAVQWSRNVVDSNVSPDQDPRCPTDRTRASHQRANVCLVELLEARSVPSGLGHFSFSGLASAIQSTKTDLISNVGLPSDLGAGRLAAIERGGPRLASCRSRRDSDGCHTRLGGIGLKLRQFVDVGYPSVRNAVLPATDTVLEAANSVVGLVGVTPSHSLPIAGAASTAAGTVLDTVNSTLDVVVASPAPVVSPIDVEPGSEVASTGNATSGGVGALLAPLLSPIDAEPGSQSASTGNATSGGVETLVAPVASSIDVGVGSKAEGHATDAQAVLPAPDAGSVTIQTAKLGATALGTVSSTTGATDSAMTSSLVRGIGDEGAAGEGRLMNVPVLTRPFSIDPRSPTAQGTASAELLASDLESLERAVEQLMLQFHKIRADLADWLTPIGTAEMLLAAGMAGLACELSRRRERRRQLAKPHDQFGTSSRPGPFYRRRACPFARPGSSMFASGPTTV